MIKKTILLLCFNSILSACASTPTPRDSYRLLDGDKKKSLILIYPDLTPEERMEHFSKPESLKFTPQQLELLKRYANGKRRVDALEIQIHKLKLSAILRYSDGAFVDVTDETEWSIQPPLARLDGNKLKLGCIRSEIVIGANFLDEAESSIKIPVKKTLKLLKIRSDGATDSFQKTDTLHFVLIAECRDGTSNDVSCEATWSSSSSAIAVTGCGKVQVISTPSESVMITATYGDKSIRKQIELKH